MRLLLLLVALALIGLLLARQLGEKPPAARVPTETTAHALPTVPTRPQDLKQFEQDLNRFMQDAAAQRARQIDRSDDDRDR